MPSAKLKVMTIVGTRPEIIRLSRVIDRFDRYCEHTLVHTGQNYDYELNEVFFRELGIRKPDAFLDAAGANAAETIGKVIIAGRPGARAYQPEALMILGDTNSCLVGDRREAAARCRSSTWRPATAASTFACPEEINRRIVDHTSDINLTYSEIAREYLLREACRPTR
jgi:UDP-N-acetylglucosamine 2-epimerase (non-hydrolysing)